jgi:hypothetical protein
MEDSTAEKTRASVKTKIKTFAKGDLEHATETLSALWEIANRDKGVTAHLDSPPGPMKSAGNIYCSPQGPYSLADEALIKSIRRGVFFDRMYWTRHSKAGDMLKPIYFSSATMNTRTRQLNECVSGSFRDLLIGALTTPSG